MAGIVVIGDEVTCTGFRLAGVDTASPAPEDAATAFAKAREEADVVVVTAEYAQHLPEATLESALAAKHPTVTVIPDIRERERPENLPAKIRATLGIE
ncbi:V-type ATP synthase subunit F [Dichotomicrobium thermohalophilum]|uniref:Vacuolar-type H+-ATPase subunit F/Vma7 n=1 Tax=Dichotomicrobium thermohalophilum TaxID=933063 RepID=A0A397Q8J3_9HYPH|nr:V-type ATP synthase subunit F [Dichotomicrobium thermohalophilum]RIA56145.1 vacuolar-type H+-ATPase subunit F/Vma7 [Dichotomicrobium thermohalophilum]